MLKKHRPLLSPRRPGGAVAISLVWEPFAFRRANRSNIMPYNQDKYKKEGNMKTKIIRKHGKNCAYKVVPENLERHGTPWAIVSENPHLFLTASGAKGGHRYWIRFICGDPSCKGEIVVRADDLIKDFPTGL